MFSSTPLESLEQDREIHQDPSLFDQERMLSTIVRAVINDFFALMGCMLLFKHVKSTEAYAGWKICQIGYN